MGVDSVEFVCVHERGTEDIRRWRSLDWNPSISAFSNLHQSHIGRKSAGRRIGSSRAERYVDRRAHISGVDSR